MIDIIFESIQDKISEIESQGTTSQSVSLNDSLARVLEREHSSRVRGLGFSPSPNQVFDTTSQFNRMSLSSNNTN